MKHLRILLSILLVLFLPSLLWAQFFYKIASPHLFQDSASALLLSKNPSGTFGFFNDLQVCKGKGTALFCSWIQNDSLYFQSSKDGGQHWLNKAITVCPVKNAVHCQLPRTSYRGVPSIACDTGSKEFKGRIYITWSDEKHGAQNMNVFLVYSQDGGLTWTEPILVTYRPNHKHQFLPRITVNSNTGKLYLAYFDSQNSADGLHCDVYCAMSENGGLLFQYLKVNPQPIPIVKGWEPKLKVHLDDSARINLNWVQPWVLNKCRLVNASCAIQNLPSAKPEQLLLARTFVYASILDIPFETPAEGKISAIMTKPTEPAFKKNVFIQRPFKAGKHVLKLNHQKLNLPPDNYILTLYYKGENVFCWIIKE